MIPGKVLFGKKECKIAVSDKKRNPQFSPRQREIFLALAETLMPSNVGTPFSAGEFNLIVPTEEMLKSIGVAGIRGFGMLLMLYEYAAFVFLPRFKPFTRLNPEQKERYLAGWENSWIPYRRMMMIALKFTITWILLSDKKIRASLGYDPNCLVGAGK